MLAALLYLQSMSLWNRLAVRLRRLRQPRYLFGAIIGGFYFAAMFSRSFLGLGRTAYQASALPNMPDVWEMVAAVVLLLILLATWIVPNGRAALTFSEAEIAFLFPAPVRRATLIHYKLLKSQFGILFTVAFLAIISPRGGGVAAAFMRAAGWWVLLSIVQLHTFGSSFARTILLERGVADWQRRILVGLGVVGVAAGAVAWAARDLPALRPENLANIQAVQQYAHILSASPPAVWLLGPFRAAVRPFLAVGSHDFFITLGPALLILILHYFWVVRSDVAFEEASVEASQRQARLSTQAESSDPSQGRPRAWRRRRAPFPLGPVGSPAMAIFWKNLLAAGQIFSARIWIFLLFWCLVAGTFFGQRTGNTGWPQAVSFFAQMLMGWTVIAGPQLVRYDFRHDLAAADLLKSYPIKGWQMALGEILAPAAILTGIQWLLLGLVAALRMTGHGAQAEDSASGLELIALPLTAAIVAPMLNGLALLIPNGAALLLPGWFASSGSVGSGRGIEVVGQRLIFVLGQMIVLSLGLLPAAIAFFLADVFVADFLVGEAWSLPFCGLVAAVVLAVEFGVGVGVLGHWFETYDLSAEQLS